MTTPPTLNVVCTVLGCLLIFGCGYELRSTSIGSHLGTVSVQGADAPLFVRELKRELQRQGIGVTLAQASDLSIRVVEHTVDESVALTAPQQGLVEYELTLRVEFEVRYSDVPEPEIESFTNTGRVRVNADKLLSTAAEDRLVRQALDKRAIEDILRHLAFKRASPREQK